MSTLRSPQGYNAQSIFTGIFMLLVITLACGYAYYQAQAFLAGPEIAFTSPENSAVIEDGPDVTITGTAERIAFLELNDRQIYINAEGVFEEKLILSPGVNIIKLEAEDRFGREISRKLQVFYEQE